MRELLYKEYVHSVLMWCTVEEKDDPREYSQFLSTELLREVRRGQTLLADKTS